ncbi:MAG: ornithine carbamoyltransferase [Magnetococcus sp. WYHC-3]
MTPSSQPHLLSLADLSHRQVTWLFHRTTELKASRHRHQPVQTLSGRTLGMLFEKPSTRTRVSFETGMFQMGGQAIFLSERDLQLGRGESLSDSARVLSRFVDALMVRTFAHHKIETLASHSTIPVINGLTDDFHPCQVLADLYTWHEHRGSIQGRKVAWVGDGNNMANTWIQAAPLCGFHLVLACPEGYDPQDQVMGTARQRLASNGGVGSVTLVRDPRQAVEDADLVTTDTWTSMGQEEEGQRRRQAFQGYTVDQALMDLAHPEALFMHCLPAHRDEEVAAEVIDGPQSVVWDEAENRLHVQKAILEWLILNPPLSA